LIPLVFGLLMLLLRPCPFSRHGFQFRDRDNGTLKKESKSSEEKKNGWAL